MVWKLKDMKGNTTTLWKSNCTNETKQVKENSKEVVYGN